jgi:uncharacterized membrane protein
LTEPGPNKTPCRLEAHWFPILLPIWLQSPEQFRIGVYEEALVPIRFNPGATMLAKLGILWERIRTSYWFVPSVMVMLAIALSFWAVERDRERPDDHEPFWLVFSGGPEGSREVLSVIAGSMVTVAGIVFSITIVILSLASSQFGSRLLRTFMKDPGTQFTLGAFLSTFIYSLLVLRTVRSEDYDFVPQLAVTLAIALSVLSIGVLIYFIHHIAREIQADWVIAEVAEELNGAVDRRLKREARREPPVSESFAPTLKTLREREPQHIRIGQDGYVRSVEERTLLRLATKHDVILRLRNRPGDFVVRGDVVVDAWKQEGELSPEVCSSLSKALTIGPTRIRGQDILFLLDQLVEIAIRALSPSINDPFTAIHSLDRLRAALIAFVQGGKPSPYRFDEEGKLRLLIPIVQLEELIALSFGRLRAYAESNILVSVELIRQMGRVIERAEDPEDLRVLLKELEIIHKSAVNSIDLPEHQQTIERAYQNALSRA